MKFLFSLILPILFLFRLEIIYFIKSITLDRWILLFFIITAGLIVFQKKVKFFIVKKIPRIKYFRLRKYQRKILVWIENNNSDSIGEIIVNKLERNILLRFGLIVISTSIFSHYPKLLTSPKPATIFLLILNLYFLLSISLRKNAILFISLIYIFIAISPYIMALLSLEPEINVFETIPIELIYILKLNINNLMETANKLFLYFAPICGSIILFCVLISIICRRLFKMIVINLLKITKTIVQLFEKN